MRRRCVLGLMNERATLSIRKAEGKKERDPRQTVSSGVGPVRYVKREGRADVA